MLKNSSLFTRFLPIGFIFLLTLIFFYPVMFQGKTFFAFDTLFDYLPWSSSVPQNFKAHNTLITDPVNMIYVDEHWFRTNIYQKRFSFWNESVFGGGTSTAGGVSSTFPSNPIIYFFFLLFPITTAHDLMLWFHLLGTGLFSYLYLREIGLKSYPAMIGSVALMFNGYSMVWFEFEFFFMMTFSLIAILYFIEGWLRTRKMLTYLFLICSIAYSICIGSAPLLIFQFIFLVFYLLYRCFLINNKIELFQKKAWRQILGLSLAAFLGICVSANFVVSAVLSAKEIATSKESIRKPIPFAELYNKTGQLPSKYLTTLLFPDFFGNPATNITFTPRERGAQPYNNYNELCIYSGILTLFLALACIPYPKKKFAFFFFLTAIIPLMMAMGSVLYYPIIKIFPGLSVSTPSRILYIFGFSISMLSAIGADCLLTAKDKKRWVILTFWILLLGIGLLIALIVQTEGGVKWAASSEKLSNWNRVYSVLFQPHFDIYSKIIFKPLFLIVASFLLLAAILFIRKEQYKNILLISGLILLSYDLMSFGLFYNTVSPKHLEYPKTGSIRFLQKDKSKFRIMTFGRFMHNTFIPFGIEDIGGYSSFYPKRYGEYLHLSQHGINAPVPDTFSRWTFFQRFGSPLLDLMNAKYALIPPSGSIKLDGVKLVYDNEIKIYENKNVFPRIFFVPAYKLVNSRQEAYKAMGSFTRADFREKVILESLPPIEFQINNKVSKNKATAKINIISYKSNRIELEFSANEKGFLVISNNYHPGWHAKIDGQEKKIFRANYIMQSVPIEGGDHRVVISFRSMKQMVLLCITAIGWFVLIGAIGIISVKRLYSFKTS